MRDAGLCYPQVGVTQQKNRHPVFYIRTGGEGRAWQCYSGSPLPPRHMSENVPPKSSNYRLECKYVALTYSDCDRLDYDTLYTAITANLGQIPDYALFGRELHPTTGAQHYHVLVYFGRGIRTRNQRWFDVGGVHPNVQSVREPRAWHDYCQKDGGDIRTFGVLPPKLSNKSGDWSECLAKAEGRDDFLERVKTSFARDWILFNDRIVAFADRYFQKKDDYVPPAIDFRPTRELKEWSREFIQEVSHTQNTFTRVLILI